MPSKARLGGIGMLSGKMQASESIWMQKSKIEHEMQQNFLQGWNATTRDV
jgi:hypothetical protein